MRYDTGAPVRAARQLGYADQYSSPLNSSTQRQCAFPAKRTGGWARAVTPEQILKSFSTRAFRREKPDKPELMLEFIAQAHARQAPIPFVQYWGKGLRPMLATPEYVCLDYLDSMMSRVAEIYEPGAEFTLVFTDTHAALNGHSQASIHSYFQDLVLATRGRRFKIFLLGNLVNAAGLPPDETAHRQLPPPDLLADLRTSAAKWFKGEGSVDEGAIRYFQANMVERKVMECAFPRSIFVTFNGSQLKSLFPESLPIFYMFSLRHGISDKPWFLPPDFTGRKPALHEQSGGFQPAVEARGGPTL